MNEPRIEINNYRLTEAEAMTVRVAIEHFASSLRSDGLGEDEHGIRMTKAYLERIDDIRAVIFKNQ